MEASNLVSIDYCGATSRLLNLRFSWEFVLSSAGLRVCRRRFGEKRVHVAEKDDGKRGGIWVQGERRLTGSELRRVSS